MPLRLRSVPVGPQWLGFSRVCCATSLGEAYGNRFSCPIDDRPGPVSAQVCSVLADLLMSKSMVPMVISQLPYLVELLSADFLPQLYHVNVLRYRPLAPGH